MYALILLVVPLINALATTSSHMMLIQTAVSMKSMVSEAIYRKALCLSSISKGSTSTGQLVNIMSSDTNSLVMFALSVSLIITIPFIVSNCSLSSLAHRVYPSCDPADGQDHLGGNRHLLLDGPDSIYSDGKFAQGTNEHYENW